VQVSGLKDGRSGFGIHPTWPAQFSLMGIPIDHLLISPELSVHHFTTGPHVGSDHLPVLFSFSLHPN